MAQSQSKSPAGTSSFASGLLARFNASTKAAQDARRKALLAQAEKRKREEERRKKEEKERIREEVDRIVERNVSIPRKSRRRNNAQARNSGQTRSSAQARPRERDRVKRLASPIRKPRPQHRGPPKPLPGMEFVVRKTERKSIKVPHSSDYSDMFGDQYLIGVDLAVTKQMAKKTAEAAKENAIILKEKEERRQQKVKEAEEITRKENELRAKGLLTEKRKRKLKCAASAKDWVAVDAPAPIGAKLKDLVTRPVGSDSAPKVRSEKQAEKVEAKLLEREVSQRKKQLRERILAMAGGGGGGGGGGKTVKKRAREAEDEPRRKRRRFSDDDEPRRNRLQHSDDDEPVRKRPAERNGRRNGYSKREERRYSRDRGYNSEEWSDFGDDDDDDDDDEDLYGIEALDREEERSRRIAAQEDKMERKKEQQRQKQKERRRREHERKYGY